MTEASLRMPQLTTSLLQRFGDKWTYSLAVNDLYYDFMGPSLSSAGKAGTDAPHNISAGDGSESAFAEFAPSSSRWPPCRSPCRTGLAADRRAQPRRRQAALVGYVSGIHLVTVDNIAYDGGPKNVFDPDNGYRDVYKKIWGVK